METDSKTGTLTAAEYAAKVKELATEKAKVAAKAVDESVHNSPWLYIGGVAVGALLLGYILGRKSKD